MFNDNWDKTKERFEALWQRERIGRPTVSILFFEKSLSLQDNTINLGSPTSLVHDEQSESFERYFTDPEFMYTTIKSQLERICCVGDAFLSVNPYLGSNSHSAFTTKSKYQFADETIWFFPVIDDIEKDEITFDDSSELLKVMRSKLDYLINIPGRRFVVSNTDNCSSLDALASLRGSQDLLVDMLTEEDHIKRHIGSLQSILWKTESEFLPRLVSANDGGTSTDWMQLWCPGKHHQLQCDISVMISPELFEKYALPELEQNAEWFDHTVYHLDGQEQIRHLDMLLSIKGLDLIQWTPVAAQPDTSTFIEVLKRIQKAGKGLVLMPKSNEMPKLLDELDPAGVHYVLQDIKTLEEANDMMRLIDKKTG